MQTPNEFITKWKASTLKERSASQEHFLDLCRLIGHPTPAQSDPTGEHFTFERGASKTGSGQGWADVWKRGYFAWEYKGKSKDLNAAFAQLQRYAIALENPPLLVVSDMETIVIHTNWTNTVQEIHTIAIEELERPEVLQKLSWLFTEPERLKPGITREMITEKAASTFAGIAQRLRDSGYDSHRVAHFVNKLIFAMFAEDIGILPGKLFTRLVESVQQRPDKLSDKLQQLFSAMKSGGDFGVDEVPWFNGGLFDDQDALPLDTDSVKQLLSCCRLDWSDIEPAIFGTLFERGLDPSKRSQLGAHYTDRNSIMRIVGPVVIEPLEREWDALKIELQTLLTKGTAASKKKAGEQYNSFMTRLRKTRVLDPACGSGNFLYLTLIALKSLEHRIMLEAEVIGLHRDFPQVGPLNVMGIELNDYAAELARVSVWIGDIQWNIKNGMGYSKNPILQTLNNVENRDALMNEDSSEAEWPEADCIVGNPPFLGDKMMRGELGDTYVEKLRKRYEGRVPGGADLVTYWFEKARAQIEVGQAGAAGLVTTNSIRQKRNRVVLERILESTRIFTAWSDEEWVNEGAAVRVSLVCFGGCYAGFDSAQPTSCSLNGVEGNPPLLNGIPVAAIHADLTGSVHDCQSLDLTQARPLPANKGRSFFGLCLAGPFKVDTATALKWLKDTGNPNGRPNSDVVRPIYNGSDITRRWAGNWVVDFAGMEQAEAADYLAPFAQVEADVKPVRVGNREAVRAEKWWRHGRRRPELRAALHGFTHYIATSETAKHRFFVKFPVEVAPEHKLIVIPSQLDVTLGILSSRIHCLWAIENGGRLGVGNDPVYNTSLCFETFPFPPGFDLKARTAPEGETFQAIATAAADLNDWREKWLNPEGWLDWEITPEEQTAGFPSRPVPKPEHAAAWKKRTLTNLYNEMPTGLMLRQERLDKAIAAAYDWNDYTPEMADDVILGRLLALNLERATH
jgi:type II restriction/modification system DNA methylase subunit YeeA